MANDKHIGRPIGPGARTGPGEVARRTERASRIGEAPTAIGATLSQVPHHWSNAPALSGATFAGTGWVPGRGCAAGGGLASAPQGNL